jgi:hypothetical protein
VPAALPLSGSRTVRVAACLACALTACLMGPARARALDLAMAAPRARDGRVLIEAHPGSALNARVAGSLARGMPATLQIHAELWRDRRAWFDRLESSADASVRIRYDVWSDTYLIERIGAEPIVVGSADSVSAVLERPWLIPIGRIGELNTNANYYVVLTATLRPLTVEDLEEVEGWLSGEVGTTKKSGFGVVTEIPRSVFDAVRNVAGFGDQKARAISEPFMLGELGIR